MVSRSKVLIYTLIVWVLAQVAGWALDGWLNTYVNTSNLNDVLRLIADALLYIGSDFGIGFLVGGILFSIWDWPIIGLWLKRQRERRRNKDSDYELAKQCDEVSELIYDQAATLERLRDEAFWSRSVTVGEENNKDWRQARAAEGREEERIKKHIGPKAQAILVALKARGVNMNLWNFSLRAGDLPTASFFFAELANSLRAGDYLERSFSASREGFHNKL